MFSVAFATETIHDVLIENRGLLNHSPDLLSKKAKDMKTIGKLIVQAIRETFEAECIKDEVIEKFLQHSPHITFSKTKDRTSVSRMNKVCENVYHFGDLLDNDSINQVEMSLRINGLLAGVGKNNYIYPKEEKDKHLEELAGHPIFQSKAVKRKVDA